LAVRIHAGLTLTFLAASSLAAGPTYSQDTGVQDKRAQDKSAAVAGGVVSQPFKDLNLIREKTPQILARVEADPYGLPQPLDCQGLAAEVAELEIVLGPDVDDKTASKKDGSDLVSDALRSALGLPMRGLVRKVSGAERRDRAHARAVLAGIARRSFLKGVVRTNCPA
jgi:hypothetical protein